MRLFGITITFLLAALAVAAMTLTGMMPALFGDEFSKKVAYASFGETPCPTEGAFSEPAAGTELQILNASSTSGLAGSLAASLEEQGYAISLIDNATKPFRGNIQMDVGPSSVNAAYSLARYFHEPVRIKLSELPAGTISVTLGEGYQGLLPAEELEAVLNSRTVLRGLNECLPIDPDTIEVMNLPQSGQQSGAQSGAQSGD